MEKGNISVDKQRQEMAAQVGDAFFAETLFDAMSDIVFFLSKIVPVVTWW